MADQVIARQQGDDFQARMFWLAAASLLDEDSGVARVQFEMGPKAFDDVVIEYEKARAPLDHFGVPFLRDHKQCKWHVSPGDFGADDFILPDFIGGKSVSFLERARAAQKDHAPLGEGARFQLVTNWGLKPKDLLRDLIRNQTNAFDIDKIFVGGAASKAGKIRALWSNHLNIDEDELRFLLRTLGVNVKIRSGEDLRDQLNDRLRYVGLRGIPSNQAACNYDDLIRKLHAQKRNDFDRKKFREMVNDEGLLVGPKEPAKTTVGVKSFMHHIDEIENRASVVLNLVPHFDGRFLKDGFSWDANILPELRNFILQEARKGDHIQLILDAHASLAFAVGSVLNVKSGKSIEVEQRTIGRRFWRRDDVLLDPSWPTITAEVETVGAGDQMALAISLTHDIAPAVREFIKTQPSIGKLLVVNLSVGVSGASIKSGSHAMKLVEDAVAEIKRQVRTPMLHVFAAAPNAFTFFLGQHQQALGPCSVYEWDFEGLRSNTYSKGLTIL